jgi:ribulose-bisphosphate carboxylase small chain
VRVTQGTFSYLDDLTDAEIAAQVRYCIDHGWALAVEFTDDPHPRNVYWQMWGLPLFDATEPDQVVGHVNRCREAFPDQYIRLTAYDASLGRQTTALSFIVNRPPEETGFGLVRQEGPGRTLGYTVHPYATNRPTGMRYGAAAGRGDGN